MCASLSERYPLHPKNPEGPDRPADKPAGKTPPSADDQSENSPTDRKFKFKDIWILLKETYLEWNADDPFRQSAVVAYYAIFSLPALLIIIVNVAGIVLGKEAVQGEITSQISGAIGAESAQQVETMIANAAQQGHSTLAIIIGVATLLFGATGVFYQLQQSLNYIWEVKANPKAGILKLVTDRATSLGLIVAIGFLLLISLALTSLLSALGDYIERFVPEYLMVLFFVVEFLVSLGVITLLFATMFKFLPDVKIAWRTVWIGAIATAVLFVIGKFALGIYFGKSDPGSAYGAAGSIILMLLWVSYSSLILFFGAEFTQVYARHYGHNIEPSAHAIRMPAWENEREQRRKRDRIRERQEKKAGKKE